MDAEGSDQSGVSSAWWRKRNHSQAVVIRLNRVFRTTGESFSSLDGSIHQVAPTLAPLLSLAVAGVCRYYDALRNLKLRAKAMYEKRRLHLLCRRHGSVHSLCSQYHAHYLKSLTTKTCRLERRIKLLGRRYSPPSPPKVEVLMLDPPSCICQCYGAIMWREESTRATRNRQLLRFSLCCSEGKVKLPLLREPPTYLKWLLESTEEIPKQSHANIRAYNASFSFISMGEKINHTINHGQGVYVFSISGQVYHQIGSLLPMSGTSPKFAQLYIHDTGREIMNIMDTCYAIDEDNPLDPVIIDSLRKMLDEHNQLVQVFRFARDTLADQHVQSMEVRSFGSRQRDGRQYDMPTTVNELAALVVTNTGIETFNQDIVVQLQSAQLYSQFVPS